MQPYCRAAAPAIPWTRLWGDSEDAFGGDVYDLHAEWPGDDDTLLFLAVDLDTEARSLAHEPSLGPYYTGLVIPADTKDTKPRGIP